MFKLYAFLLVNWLCSNVNAQTTGCTITLPTDMPKFEPIIFVSNGVATYNLFKPTGQQTTLAVGTKLLLFCDGNKNVINSLNVAQLELYCKAGNIFTTAQNVQHSFSNLGCKSIPSSTLISTAQSCSNGNGNIFQAGFSYGSSANTFVRNFDICYNNKTDQTFYTQHTLNGATINFAIQESTRRAFSADGMTQTTTAVNNLYTIKNQISRYESYFGANQQYVSNSNFIARGHLTPDADFIFSYEQLSTYYYMNVAPEYQVVNAGNWIRVENQARKIAGNLGRDLSVYNGYLDVLALPNAKKNLIDIYLDTAEKFPVVLYYFKVLKDALTNTAIVFITLNNPFADEAVEFCTNICASAGYANSIFKDFSRGYTFCCELNDFLQTYKGLPQDLHATGVLTATTV